MANQSNNQPGSGSAMNKVGAAADRLTGWALLAPGEISRMVAGMSKGTMAWVGIGLAAVILVSVNVVSTNLFRAANADLTASGLYSLSDSTSRVMGKIGEPIDVRIYFSEKLGDAAPLYKRYFERVRALFDQYANMAGNKLRVSFIDPQPFSDAEDRAVAAGLRGIRLNNEGDQGFFGLVATNSTDQQEVVQFFSPQRERYLEYDMTKLVHKLSVPKKLVIGVMSGIPVMGGQQRPRFPGQQPQQLPKWVVMDQIEDFFEVQDVPLNVKEIPKNVDVLMLIQPGGLQSDTAFAIDQFALKGGRVLAFIDPVPDVGRMMAPASASAAASPPLQKLLDAWGVKIDSGKAAGDLAIARRVQTGGARPAITEYVAWLAVKGGLINGGDVVTDGVKLVHLASSGFIAPTQKPTTKLQPLLQTSDKAMQIESAWLLGQQPDPVQLLRDYKPGDKSLILAARVQGDIKTAFPDGPPKPKEDPKKAAAGEDKAAKSDDKTKEAAKDGAAKSYLKSGKLNAIVFADSDLLYDEFWVQRRNLLGQQMTLPIAHNAVLVVNALENLTGGEALSGLRGRGVDDRPFEYVDGIRREAEQQFRQKEQALVRKLSDVRDKLSKVEKRTKDGGVILSDSDRAEIEKFRGEMIETRKELRDVKHAMRADIDALESFLKFINIAGVPLLLGFGGLALAYFRRRRNAHA
ncbi:MAG: Gldg family protein [Pseudomonadota bacterium]